MSTNGSHAVLSPKMATISEPFSQGLLSSSISSLSSTTASRHPSQMSKTYRQASTLFLTRRLPEALSTLLPLITPPEPVENGEPAPVARASRTTRVKLWSLYLTVLNAIVEMGPEEGKDAFGNQEWRALCAKVRDGDLWEEVVRNGYHGVEGDVDPDVVINLATLLLAHARDQNLNQSRLEAYLATSTTPSLDISGRISQSQSPGPRSHRYRSPAKGTSGATTPRDLNARVKILELYTLHVLLRNDEWDYAREFITMSSVLDEERREAFLQALQSLREDQLEQERLQRDEKQRQEDQLKREVEEARRLRAENEERERRRLEDERSLREGSETDYGVEDTPSIASSAHARQTRPPPRSPRPLRSSISQANGKKTIAPPQTFIARASIVVTRLRALIDQLSASLNHNPMLLMRFMAFVIGMLLMLGHSGIRERVKRLVATSWGKIRATAGMGTKVSYI